MRLVLATLLPRLACAPNLPQTNSGSESGAGEPTTTTPTTGAPDPGDLLAIDFFPYCARGEPRADNPGLIMTSGGAFYVSDDRGETWQRQLPDAPGKPHALHVFDDSGIIDAPFHGISAQVAIGSQLWAINPLASDSSEGWVMLKDFGTPILSIFDWTATVTKGQVHYFRDGFRCSNPD